MQLFLIGGTVSKVQIYQCLIRYSGAFRLCFKIIYSFVVNVNCYLFFQLFCIWVFRRIGKIVFISHGITPYSLYCAASPRVARRAEIMRITVSD